MIVGLDATFLLYFFAKPEDVGVPKGEDGEPIPFAKERVGGLIADLEKGGSTIVVSTPALSEIMVRSGVQAGQSWAAIMRASKIFTLVPFDEKSAIEVALMAGHSVRGERAPDPDAGTHAKLKYDRQIVAVAKTEGATAFYTDDKSQRNLATRLGMSVKGLADCIVPTQVAQTPLPLEGGHGDKPPERGPS